MVDKVCTTCKQNKPLSEYSPRKNRPLGIHYSCKVCLAAKAREWRKTKVYTEEYKEKARVRAAKWREENPEWNSRIKREWSALHRHTKRAAAKRYEQRKNKRTPPWLTDQHHHDISMYYWLAQDLKKVTGDTYHVDHIVPLNGRDVCGLHVPWNLQVLPADVNLSKGATYNDAY